MLAENSTLRLQTSVIPVKVESGLWLFLRPGNPLRVRGGKSLDSLVSLLTKATPIQQIVENLSLAANVSKEAAAGCLDKMIKKGLIFEERECQREKKADARYARQIDQFAQYETDKISRFHFQEKLRSASVVIIGVGGLGSWIAANLTMAGIGTITLVDGDHVELSNLNRQILYHEGDLGRPKAEAAKEALEKINDDVQFKCIQSYVSSQSCAEKILSECPGAIVVLAADEPLLKLRAWVADACLKMGSKLIMVASGGIGPLIIPNHETPCWECQKKYLESLYPEVENWMQELDAPSRNGLPQPIMPGYHSMMAGLLTTEMIKLITSIQEPNTLGTILAWQPGTSTVVQEKIFRHPECVNHPEEA